MAIGEPQVSKLDLSSTRPRGWALGISERRVLLMVGDLLAVSIALGLAVWVRIPGYSTVYTDWRLFFVEQIKWWLLLWAIWIPASIIAGCYEFRVAASLTTSAVYTGACALVVALIYFLIPWLSAPLTFSRTAWFVFAFLSVAGVGVWRALYATFVARPTFTRRALVIGASEPGIALAEAVDEAGIASGIDLVGYIDEDSALWGKRVRGRPILAGSEKAFSIAASQDIDEIVVATEDPAGISQELFHALVGCWEHGVDIVPMSLYYEEVAGAIPLDHVGRNLFVLVDRHRGLELRIWGWVRRLADIAAGLTGLLVLAPFLPLISLAIRLDSPGPVLYRQTRVGRGGRGFMLFKFRSMVDHAEQNGAVWAQAHDVRVTRVGRFLRSTRLDELPQLWNVLKGDMTLIGPRPERPEFVQELGELLPYYAIRHSIKPGITGWAQVRYHYGNCVDDARMKLQYDLYYVKRRGPVLDALIVLHTIRVMATFRGT